MDIGRQITTANSAFAIAWLDIEKWAANHFSALVSADNTLLGISS